MTKSNNGPRKANISWGNRHISFVDFDIFKKHDFFFICIFKLEDRNDEGDIEVRMKGEDKNLNL